MRVYPEDDLFHCEVEDTGIGIPKERQRAIFESFSQAESSTARKFGGTGLGLAITARLVEMMGGQIWVESEVGRGSTFHARQLAEESEPAEKAIEEICRQLRVLVVCDHPVHRGNLEETLQGWGAEVVPEEPADVTLVDGLASLEGRLASLVLLTSEQLEQDIARARARGLREPSCQTVPTNRTPE